ncbi:MAG: lmo0937 family membrane protein [Flavobacteriales bacterium]
MNNTLNLLIVVLIIGWLAGFFAFPNVGGIIHLLLVIALILVVYRLVTGRKIN